jgi:hypothetical protein
MAFLESTNLNDIGGSKARIGGFEELKVAEPKTDIPLKFDLSLDLIECDIIGEVNSQVNGSILQVIAGDSPISTFTSRCFARYRAGQTTDIDFTASWNRAGVNGEEAVIGLTDGNNEIAIGYVNSDFVLRVKNENFGTDLVENLNVADYDLKKLHRFVIVFGYLGVADPVVKIYPKTNDGENANSYKVLGRLRTDGVLENRTHIGASRLPFGARVDVSGGESPSDLILSSGSVRVSTYGDVNTGEIPENKTFITGLTPGTFEEVLSTEDNASPDVDEEQVVMAFRINGSFTGGKNICSQLLDIAVATGSEGQYLYRLIAYQSGTLTTYTFSDISNKTPLQYSFTNTGNSGATDIPIGGEEKICLPLSVLSSGTGVGTLNADLQRARIIGRPNDEFLLVKSCIIGGGGTDKNTITVRWLDLI